MTQETFNKACVIMAEISELSRFNNSSDRIISIQYKSKENYLYLKVSIEFATYIEEAIQNRLKHLNNELDKL